MLVDQKRFVVSALKLPFFDPENFFFLLYAPNGKAKHKGENAANYQNMEFDHLYEAMRNMENSPQRQEIVDRMIEILQHVTPWLWGVHPKSFGLYHDWVFNSKPNLMANNTLKYRRIDPSIRTAKRQDWNEPVTWPLWSGALLLGLTILPAVVTYRRRQRERPHTSEHAA